MGVLTEIGARPFINGRGPMTRFGGANLPPEVVAAMAQAANHGFMMSDLQASVGKAIAHLTRNEAAYVSCGAASGITLTIAACMAGTDESKANLLPCTNGMPNEIVFHSCDQGTECDVAIRCSGAKTILVGNGNGATERQVREALGPQTAAIVVLLWEQPGKLSIERLANLAHDHGVPLLVDAAGAVPPRENLWHWTRKAGADAIFVSGGKGIRGPQGTGLVLGSQAIVDGCAFHGVPNGRIGRGMKVGKESMVGLYAAVKLFMSLDEAEEERKRTELADQLLKGLEAIPEFVTIRLGTNRVSFSYDPVARGLTYSEFCHRLLEGDPAVLLSDRSDGVHIFTETLETKDIEPILSRVREVLNDRES